LLRNHFHFLVRVKAVEELDPRSQNLPCPSRKPSQYFSNLFNAYAKAINKAYQRTGALFQRPFGRIEVTTDAYLAQLVIYIHQNPQKHGFVDDFRTWPYSSYQTLLSSQPTRLQRDDVLAWFQGEHHFEDAHRCEVDAHKIAFLMPGDYD
jgi:putative transposase